MPIKNLFKKIIQFIVGYEYALQIARSNNGQMLWIIVYQKHEIVISNSLMGLETVYLDGEVVSEMRSWRLQSEHQVQIDCEEFRVIIKGTIPVVSLYKGETLIDSVEHDKAEAKTNLKLLYGLMFFWGVCFILGAFAGFFTFNKFVAPLF